MKVEESLRDKEYLALVTFFWVCFRKGNVSSELVRLEGHGVCSSGRLKQTSSGVALPKPTMGARNAFVIGLSLVT
jgi:hypothetical protein